jgi:PKD repeat protein
MDSSYALFPLFPNLSVSPAGEVWEFPLLDTGVYGGGTFTINTRKYYAVNYNASGSFQAAIPLDITPPTPPALGVGPLWEVDPSTNRFYCTLSYDTSYGSLAVGNTPIGPLTGSSSRMILGAFDGNGQNLWVQQGSPSTTFIGSAIADLTFGHDGTVYLAGESEPGTVFCGDTTPNSTGMYNPAFIMALDTNANLLWSNYSANSHNVNVWGISEVDNTIATVGLYGGTLTWNNDTITGPQQAPFNTYMLRVNAATGVAVQLSSFNSSWGLFSEGGILDKNGNLYINGAFSGNLVFGNDNLSSYPNSSYSNSFLLKYKNVVCNCDLLQPAFNFSNSAATTFQFAYTGQTPYASISWDFGDGTTVAGVTTPSHTYAAAGTYPVCVTVTNGCGSNTSCKYVSFTTGIKDAGGAFSSVNIYPNPAQDELTITHLPQGTTVEVLDITGRLLKRVESGNAELRMNVEGLSAGVHLLRFTDKEGRRGSSMFVKR